MAGMAWSRAAFKARERAAKQEGWRVNIKILNNLKVIN
jgi:hypothetical protein